MQQMFLFKFLLCCWIMGIILLKRLYFLIQIKNTIIQLNLVRQHIIGLPVPIYTPFRHEPVN